MKTETALEHFFSQMEQMQYFIGNDLLQAYRDSQEIEKAQIIDAYSQGEFDCGCNGSAEDYYRQKYQKKVDC